MSSITKRGSSYRAVVSIKGERFTATFPTKAECKAWASEKESEARVKKITGVIPNKTVGDILEKYLHEESPKKAGYDWERKRISVLQGYKLASVRLSELDATHVAEWRNNRLQDVSGSSVNRDWNLLSVAVETARREWKWLNSNPFKGEVKRPPNAKPRQQTYTDEQIEKITFCLGDMGDSGIVKDMFLFALETAMRSGEIVDLSKEHIYPNHVHIPESKNGSARDVPLSKKAREILAKYPNGFGISDQMRDALFRKGRDKAGVKGLRFHDARRTALTRLAKIYQNPLDLARISGHKDLNFLITTYYAPSVEDLAKKLG